MLYIRNKKGVSDVIVTVIMIVIALVAIGIVYAVVQGIVKGQSSIADLSTKCLNVGVEITSATKTTVTGPPANYTYKAIVKRTGSELGEGITMDLSVVFSNPTTGISEVVPFENFQADDIGETRAIPKTGVIDGTLTKVEVTPMVKSGENTKSCTPVSATIE